MAKGNSKRATPAEKKAAQKSRTRINKQKARNKHSKMHPNDKQSPEAWKNYPLG
jgi:hypothetical protein